MKKLLTAIIILSGLLIMFFSCSKKNDISLNPPAQPIPPVQPKLSISTINPATGPHSTVVTITGTGFSTVAANNTVKFNGMAAVVKTATETQLTVVVPKGAGTGNATVTVTGQTVTGPVFNYTYTVTVSTLAGSGTVGFEDGTGAAAKFGYPRGVAVDQNGNVYVADWSNHRIRKITRAGDVSTFAGSGVQGFKDGSRTVAQFNYPTSIALDGNNNLYIADWSNHRIRKITPAGDVSTLAGSGNGFADGVGSIAKFYYPFGIAVDANGNVYVADKNNNRIRKITPTGMVSTLAGSVFGFADGAGDVAKFGEPREVAVDKNGNVYVADYLNHRIRKITPAGLVSTFAGSGMQGFKDGNRTVAQFNHPSSIAVDGNNNLYVTDEYNHCIRIITPAGAVFTLSGAVFNFPAGIAVDGNNNLYVGDKNNHRIRKIITE